MTSKTKKDSYKTMSKSEIHDYIVKHLLKAGDDGIPNVRSDDNVFVEGIRQKPISKEVLEDASWLQIEALDDLVRERYGEECVKNLHRNKKLILLTEIPSNIQNNILDAYEKSKTKSNYFIRSKFLTYLLQNGMGILAKNINDF